MKVRWSDVEAHGKLDLGDHAVGVPVCRRGRIGDTTANGRDIVLVDDDAPDIREVARTGGAVGELTIELMEDGHSVIRRQWRGARVAYGQARVERVEDESRIFVRTPTGEYAADAALPDGCEYSDVLALHAHLHQRAALVRHTALPLPVRAGALQQALAGGRDGRARGEALGKRLSATAKLTTGGERVTVDIVLPKVRAMRLRVQAGTPLFPEFKAAPRRELSALVGEAMARMLPTRAYQAVLAAMALAYQANGVELEDDEIPKDFRLQVMRTIGMPSRAASKAQRELVSDAMAFVRHAEICVRPSGGKSAEYLPILVHTGYRDAPETPARQASRIAINPELVADMENGRLWRVPEALFQVTDERDRDSVLRLLGFQLCNRLAMGTEGHESLSKLLQRAGLWEWAQRAGGAQRGTYVLDTLRRSMDELRALPHDGHAPADIVGGAVIVGDAIQTARVEYLSPPAWVHSSP